MMSLLYSSGVSIGGIWTPPVASNLIDYWDTTVPTGTTPNTPANGADITALVGLSATKNLAGSGGGAGNITYASTGSPNGRPAVNMVAGGSNFSASWSQGPAVHWLARLKTGTADNSLLQLTGVSQTYAATRTQFYNNGAFVAYSSTIPTSTWGTVELILTGSIAQVFWEGTRIYNASATWSSGSTTNYLLFQTPGSIIARAVQYSALLSGSDLSGARLWLANA